MRKLPHRLVLDLKTWRCGGDRPKKGYGLGKGYTCLLNNQGYKCCLGQFSEQAGISRQDMKDMGTPGNLPHIIKSLNKYYVYGKTDTKFSQTCVKINDNKNTTIKEKIKQLRKIVKELSGRVLIVKGLKEFKEKGLI